MNQPQLPKKLPPFGSTLTFSYQESIFQNFRIKQFYLSRASKILEQDDPIFEQVMEKGKGNSYKVENTVKKKGKFKLTQDFYHFSNLPPRQIYIDIGDQPMNATNPQEVGDQYYDSFVSQHKFESLLDPQFDKEQFKIIAQKIQEKRFEKDNYDDLYGWDRFMIKNLILRYMNMKKGNYFERLNEFELMKITHHVGKFVVQQGSIYEIVSDIHEELIQKLENFGLLPVQREFAKFKKETDDKINFVKQLICQVCHQLACQTHPKQEQLYYGQKVMPKLPKCTCPVESQIPPDPASRQKILEILKTNQQKIYFYCRLYYHNYCKVAQKFEKVRCIQIKHFFEKMVQTEVSTSAMSQQTEICMEFISCRCRGPCDKDRCPCVGKKQCLRQFCICFGFECALGGCQCQTIHHKKKDPCQKDSCPCVQEGRVCNPDLCRGCKEKQCNNVIDLEDLKFGVSQSTIPDAGYGLFSLQNIRKGQIIGIYSGELINSFDPEQEIAQNSLRIIFQKLQQSSYLFDMPELNGRFNGFIDAQQFGNLMRFVNNAPPNSRHHNIQAHSQIVDNRPSILFKARKQIKKGQELFIFYGNEYFQEEEDFE